MTGAYDVVDADGHISSASSRRSGSVRVDQP